MNIGSSPGTSTGKQRIVVFSFLFLLVIIVFFLFQYNVFEPGYTDIPEDDVDPISANYDTYFLDDSRENRQIKYGYELFTNTAEYLGPESGRPESSFSGNSLSCTNCHLLAGTKPYSGMLIGVINRFPQFRGRENKIGTIEDRINGCMKRSMNGKELPPNGREMKAFVAYMEWLNRYAPADGKIKGAGYASIKIPNRAVDLENGKRLFMSKCASCHGEDGQGISLRGYPGYLYPPLWGEDSYNLGAGMARVITAAEFIKTNMPYGTTYEEPELSDEECYDIAGFINQQPRPLMLDLELDFPDLRLKPVSTPYPPYADSFPALQHQLGPFQPIMEFYKSEYGLIKIK